MMNWIESNRGFLCRLLLVNSAVLAAGFLIIEISFGKWIWFNEKNRICNYVLCNYSRQFEHNLFGAKQKVHYTKDEYGLRGPHKKVSDIDVLIVGGSTADQRYVDDGRTWDRLLAKKLSGRGVKLDIANAGLDGQSTIGNIWNFDVWFPLIPNLKPRYIVFYTGVNDMFPIGEYEPDKKKSDVKKDKGEKSVKKRKAFKWRSYLAAKWLKLKYDIKKNSAVYDLYRIVKGNFLARRIGVVGHIYTGEMQFDQNLRATPEDWEFYKKHYLDRAFHRRVNKLIDLTISLGAKPIFITQRTARWKKASSKIMGYSVPGLTFTYGGRKFIWSTADYGVGEVLIAQKIMSICKTRELLCVDGARIFKINDKNTYDLVHTNNLGSEEISSKLVDFFMGL